MNELELLKKKIKYRASYRGTKEMDLLLTSFISNIIDTLPYEKLKKLNEFLNNEDEEISNFYLSKTPMVNFDDKQILDLFVRHKIS